MLLPLLTLLLACEEAPPPIPGQVERTGEVIKTVNGQNVTEGMLDAMLAQMPPGTKDQLIAKNQLDMVRENLVVGELLYQEAVKQKVYDTPEMKQTLALAERDALARAVLDKVVAERTTDEAVRAWYDEHKVQFHRPQVKARHILVKEKADADAILTAVKADPSKFSQLASEKSVDGGSAKEGGDLGWFEKNRMVPEFAEAAFAGEKGAIVGPVQSKFGWHIISIDDKRDAVPVEEVSDKIKGQLRNEVIEKYIDELKKAATITEPGAAGGATVTPAAADADQNPGGLKVQKLDTPPPGMQGGGGAGAGNKPASPDKGPAQPVQEKK